MSWLTAGAYHDLTVKLIFVPSSHAIYYRDDSIKSYQSTNDEFLNIVQVYAKKLLLVDTLENL